MGYSLEIVNFQATPHKDERHSCARACSVRVQRRDWRRQVHTSHPLSPSQPYGAYKLCEINRHSRAMHCKYSPCATLSCYRMILKKQNTRESMSGCSPLSGNCCITSRQLEKNLP